MSDTQKTESSAAEQDAQASPSAESASPASDIPRSTPLDLTKGPQEAAPSANSTTSQGAAEADKSAGSTSSDWERPKLAEADDSKSSDAAPFVSKWADLFNICARIGPIYILVFIALMVWPDYWQKSPGSFCPPEVQSVTAYLHCIEQSSWLAPTALVDGAWSAPQWPLFYLFIGLLAMIPGLAEANWLIPLACASSAAIALLGAFFFTHAAGFGATAAFAAALVLFCAPIFAPLHHFFGPVTLATGLMLFSLAFFCRGWRARRAWLSLPLAFICAALAGLCGGVLYIAVPLLGSFIYLVWQGKYKRGQSLDAVTGFFLLLLVIGLWIGAISLGQYPDSYLSSLLKDSVRFAWPPQHLWYLALIAGALGILPWLLCIFGVSWLRVIKDSVKSFSASRHDNGSALMWISLILACCLCLCVPHSPIVAITIGALLAPLLGKALVRLSPFGNRFFFFLASIFTILVGCLLLALHFEPSQAFILNLLPVQPPAPVAPELLQLTAVPIIGAICILAGAGGFYFVKRARGGGGILYASLVTVIIGQVALFLVAPALQSNPRLPLKTLDAIAQEVEAVKQHVPLPETAQPLPAPTQVNPPLPEQTPEAALPVAPPSDQEQGSLLPNLTIPGGDRPTPGNAVQTPEPENAAPEANIPQPASPPSPLPGEQPQVAPEDKSPTPEDEAAGIPMTLPDAIEVPSGEGQAESGAEGQAPAPQKMPEDSGETANPNTL